jgi:diguanylate cyclase (GGDEF)-like protein
MGGVEIFSDSTPAVAALERVAEFEQLAYIDPLTGLANRRYAEIALNSRFEELERYNWAFGVIFIDIDRFKDVNDRFGHDIGDEVLRTVAKTLQNSVRSFDVVGRWGGEEFLAVIANVDGEELLAAANRFRALVEESSIQAVPGLRVTISLGATIARTDDDIASILKRVDQLMYESKAAGRNAATVG